MTAKRFTRIICSNDEYTGSLYCNDEPLKIEEVCTLLNELYEENQELRLQLNLCSDQRNEFHRGARENANRVGKLKKENEQLKTFLEALREELSLADRDNTILEKENEQLKQAYTQLKHRHSLLHDVCIDAECDRDSYRKDIVSLEEENKRLHKYLNMQTMALCDFHNRETAQMKWADKRPEFNLDKYYEVCMEESQQIYYKNDVHKRINELIIECEKGIEEIINGEKDSYIVKHDIAIKMLKKLYENLEEENSKMNREKVELNEIIGIVKTEEVTNSVELKKEAYK